MTDVEMVIAAAGGLGAGFVTFLKWAVTKWLADRKAEREALLADRREERSERRNDLEALTDIQLTLSAMLERDRVREERRKRENSPAPYRIEPETTDIHEIKRVIRESTRKTPAMGTRSRDER